MPQYSGVRSESLRPVNPQDDLRNHNVRDVASSAERHWWTSKLRAHVDGLRAMAGTSTNIGHWTQIEIDQLEAIIAERENV